LYGEHVVPPGTHDTMQVCMSGHCINAYFRQRPEFNKPFCPDCGERTITACPECKAPIKGTYKPEGMPTLPPLPPPVPSFCDACGMAYPWQVARVANALEVLRLQGVEEADVQEIEKNLPDITRETPRSRAAALRILKTLGKFVGKPAYDVGVKVIGDIAAAAAKSHLAV
jgi:hypothetical protein